LGEPDISVTGVGEGRAAIYPESMTYDLVLPGIWPSRPKEMHFSYSRREGVGRLLHKVVNLGKRKIGERRKSWQNKT
jgi:hypothetical protein